MSNIVRSEITSASFSVYTDEEKKNKLSVVHVQKLESVDLENKAVPGGLYDARMGPIDQQSTCQTCSMNFVRCPGHPGHIELDVPVYYPLYFADLVRILRCKCIYCHKTRMSTSRVRGYLIRLKLLEMGRVDESDRVVDLLNPSVLALEVKEESDFGKLDVEKILRGYEKDFVRHQRLVAANPAAYKPDLYIKNLQRDLIEQFQKSAIAVKKCENCSGISPTFRKDGANKIFQKPLALKYKRTMASHRMKASTALETVQKREGSTAEEEEMDMSDEEIAEEASDVTSSDDEEEENSAEKTMTGDDESAVKTEGDKYLAPLEVEAHMKLLWQESGEILNFVWTRSFGRGVDVDLVKEEGWRIFFMRIVLVTSNKFRPLAKVGNMVSDHPQNVHLKKIIEINSKIRLLQLKPELLQNAYGTSSAAAVAQKASEKGIDVATVQVQNQLSKLISFWIDLQNAVNCYMDSSKDPNPLAAGAGPIGIRQILERKEGLFRRHMMGKRVNFCCRSVISPDPYLGTNEIGIPVHFAKTLDYPTPVNDWNVKYLRTLVERGADHYPGANAIETPDGKLIKLKNLSEAQRIGKAKLLLATPGTKVHRHLISGDVLLVNRQPSLHKPSIMAHKARVLEHVKEQTLRFSYANCSSYNADFDGDEMNCHFVQSELARAEAYTICNTDNQYIVPTSGNPLRGLIQDHVASAVKMTCKDTFLSKADFQQLVYIAVTGLPGTEISTAMEDMILPAPTILKPRPMWTGKQVITALLANLCRPPLPKLHLDSKARTPATAMGAEHNEHEVIIRHGELLSGVLDKNAIGSVSLGIVHAIFELYGSELTGRILNAFGRLFTYYLQDAGHTCGMEDLVLTAETDVERRALLEKVTRDADNGLKTFLDDNRVDASMASKPVDLQLAVLLSGDRAANKPKLDGAMQQVINKSASNVIKACLPGGLRLSFLKNNFSMMVLTGAKGSAVNQSQITCFLGQQALEGQRVPLMASGKSLPSFKAYDGSARAGGFVQDRFLTGVKPQEYYFHCMAGREGLVDTAVKTSRSGYLQRCLVKHLEELKVNYDLTVRDSGHNVVQFLYGEDGVDPMHSTLLGGKAAQMLFLARNNQALAFKYSLHEDFFRQGIEMASATRYHAALDKCRKLFAAAEKTKDLDEKWRLVTKGAVLMARKKISTELPWGRENIASGWDMAEVTKVREESRGLPSFDLRYSDGSVEKKVPVALFINPRPTAGGMPASHVSSKLPTFLVKIALPDTPMSRLRLGSAVGAISEKMQAAITSYINSNPDGVIVPHDAANAGAPGTVTPEAMELLIWIKYMRSLACPGEAVGCVAAQSVGEPSTQMTLNTFHLAGHGGANVTLGIPRLREIIMTASRSLKTPTMTLPILGGNSPDAARTLARSLSRLPLSELLDHRGGITVGEAIVRDGPMTRWERKYRVRLSFQNPKKIRDAFGIDFSVVAKTVQQIFLRRFDAMIKQEQRRAGESTAGKNDSLRQFKSMGGDSVEGVGRSRGDADGEEDAGRTNMVADYESGESEDEDAEDIAGNDDVGNLRLAGSGRETMGYDDDDDSSDDEEKSKEDGTNSEASSDSDSDGEAVFASSAKKASAVPTKATKIAKASGVVASKDFQFNNEEGWVEMTLRFPITSRRLLMAQIAEKAATATMVRWTKDLTAAYVVDGNVQTAGVNFEAVWDLPAGVVDVNNISSNDIYRVLVTYGVEAARQSIVSEIQGVFGVYGIDVNPRHLSLIADYMTRQGSYNAMNRIGMFQCPSPLLQMSFETTCTFLTKAAQEGLIDNHESPSARIVLGGVPKVGTGVFDLMLPLQK